MPKPVLEFMVENGGESPTEQEFNQLRECPVMIEKITSKAFISGILLWFPFFSDCKSVALSRLSYGRTY